MNGDSGRLFCNKLERRQRNWQRQKYQKQPQTPNHYETNFGLITLRQTPDATGQGQPAEQASACMPRCTTPSIFNAISSRDQRCGSFEPKRRANGGMRWRQCDRASCFGLLRSREVNLTTPARLFPLIFMTSCAERKRLLGRLPWPLIGGDCHDP